MRSHSSLIALNMRDNNLWAFKLSYTNSKCHLSDRKAAKINQVKVDKPSGTEVLALLLCIAAVFPSGLLASV